jgi:hypothetical protein
VRLLLSEEGAALLQCLWRLRLLPCADTNSTLIVLALKLPLERNIHSLPQPAGPVKVANGGHLSGAVGSCRKRCHSAQRFSLPLMSRPRSEKSDDCAIINYPVKNP